MHIADATKASIIATSLTEPESPTEDDPTAIVGQATAGEATAG